MVSPVKTQGMNTGEFLLSEAAGTRSREAGVFAFTTGTTIPSGTVLGVITASGKLAKYVSTNSDGSQVAKGVLLTSIDAATASGDIPVTWFARECEVIGTILNGGAGTDATGKAGLLAQQIIIR